MSYWKNNREPTCYRENDIVYIEKLNRARSVSDFIRSIESGRNQGIDDFLLDFSGAEEALFPNAVAPIAGIIEHYKSKGIKFEFDSYSRAIQSTKIFMPTHYDAKVEVKVLGKVWFFQCSDDVNELVNAYIKELQKSAQFYKGVLNVIEWSLNEVMDNVIQHSKIGFGCVMGQIHSTSQNIAFTIFDAGQGIYNSLKSSIHKPKTAVDAITLAIQEEVTRDTKIGQGNGLFGLHSIVKQGQGKLVITSGGGSYSYSSGRVNVYDRLPVFSRETPGTIVDFQLNYSKDMSIDKALVFRGKQYPLTNIHFEDLEDEYGIVHYSIKDHAEGTGTRDSAMRVKNEIHNILTETRKPIVLDFSGIEVISSSFADELLAKLFLEFGLFQFNNMIRIRGLDQSQQTILHRSVLQRIIAEVK